MTIAEFLLERIAEREARAHAARRAQVDWLRMSDWIAERSVADVGLFVLDHDPARVLAECEAKRQIVERHRSCMEVAPEGTCGDLRALASVYADHPDYRDEWRP